MIELKSKQLFLLDMDGTIYLDNKLIPGAKEFLRLLESRNKHYVFLTNNSSKRRSDYLDKLHRLGINATIDNIFTSGNATAIYLNNLKPHAKLYVIGTKALKQELEAEGFNIIETETEDIDYLVVGYDSELTYEKLVVGVHLLNRGIKYIATNMDLVYPAENNEFLPDCGSICNMLKTATNREPFYIGKPRKEMVELVSNKFDICKEEVVVIGDRLYTDIACGLNANVTSVLVLSGETKSSDLAISSYKPSYVFPSIYEVYLELIKEIDRNETTA